ncbi:MAG: flagellar type III secretion system pore protein FliP [Firmicutes bacterium]|nr:flagellar type III secretion system pore protein FliP [Bacillota bacterium]
MAEKTTLALLAVFLVCGALVLITSQQILAAPAVPTISFGISEAEGPQDVALSLQVLFLLTILSLAPSILIMMTSFTRIVIVLSFVRSALSTQQMPPNQILIGLALFMTFFIMAPTWQEINQNALQPYLAGEIDGETALGEAMAPLREFMFKQTREKDLELFVAMSRSPRPENPEDVPTNVLIPSFIISELKTAFQLGFMIFIPFMVIDMIVASTLMSMGMLMLPPVMISLPFKILLFVLVDGWYLVVRSVLLSFR